MFFETFLQDLRVGLRVLIKEKGFCALAVLVLALGICAVTTQFGAVNGVVLRGFSFPEAERLVSVQFVDPSPATPRDGSGALPSQTLALDYQELAAHQRSYDYLAAYIAQATVNLSHQGEARRYNGAYVTEHFLKALGVAPILGRDLAPADNAPGAEKVALIAYKMWQRDFAAAPGIVGTAVTINGRPATIVGVLPPDFGFPSNEEVWVPLFNEYPVRLRHERALPGGAPALLARLRRGVTLDQATAEATTFASRLAREYPDTNKLYHTGLVEPLIKTFTPPNIQRLMYSMLAVCCAVLLLACANVMNMQFARATLRAKELAVRSSLGATRARLIRQMLTESLLLASLGALLGVGLAYYATDFLNATLHNLPVPIPPHIHFDIDGRVLLAVVAATMLSAILSGVLPAWMASRANAVEVLKEGGRGNTGRMVGLVTRGLVVAQILLTCLILIASLLQLKSILRQQRIDYGYDTHALMTARMGLMDGSYPTGEARRLFYERLLRELRASGDIAHASLSNRTRMAFASTGPARIEIEGRDYREPRDRPNLNVEQVSDGFFATLGVRLLEGRDFTPEDSAPKLPVAIVNATFARKHFGAASALGRRFRTTTDEGRVFGPWRTIVGVVSDVRMLGPFNNPGVEEYGFYVPLYASVFGPAQPPAGPQFVTLVVQPRQGPAALFATPLRRAVARVDPHLPLYFLGTPAENLDTFIGANRVIAAMFTLFGIVATLLAAVGLYGVMSFAVNRRTQEFGIRMALGADHRRILGMVVRQGTQQLALGLALGLGLAFALAVAGEEVIRQLLFDTSPRDPLVFGGVALLLAAVAFVATYIPARRATQVDPMIALRAE